MDESEPYGKKFKKHSKEKEKERMKKLKNIFLYSASVAEQSIRCLEEEKTELEIVLERIRRYQLPIKDMIRDPNTPTRSISILHELDRNAEMRSTIEAVEKILSVFDKSLLQDHPKERKQFKDHPLIEKRVLQFAAKAHFIKTSYDIKPRSSITRSSSI
ncbi:hypothetical protein SUGI_0062640 [Cryptomeria japonica]|nr:hypothetical protein SUGI_0062640 [Cryptomeria japonica]